VYERLEDEVVASEAELGTALLAAPLCGRVFAFCEWHAGGLCAVLPQLLDVPRQTRRHLEDLFVRPEGAVWASASACSPGSP